LQLGLCRRALVSHTMYSAAFVCVEYSIVQCIVQYSIDSKVRYIEI
jgi:hypothetical protein